MFPHFHRASVLYQQGRYDQAIGELHLHLGQTADDPVAHALLALCFAHKEQYAEATGSAQRAVHLAPDQPLGHYALAQIMLDRRRLPEAKLAIKEAIRLDPRDPDYFAILAGIYLQESRWHEALAAANEGLQADPEHPLCTNFRAQAQVKLGDRAAAAATMAQALARQPDDAYTHANQGWTLLHEGDANRALEHFREALRLRPDLDWARAGIVEAMKARNLVYRLMLAWFLWMARLSPQTQWGLIVGLFLGQMVIRRTAANNPALAPYLWPILIAYIGFVLLTWLSYPLFNLLLRLNKFGRYALSRDQTRGANVLLVCLAATATMAGVTLATGKSELWIFTGMIGLLSLPASAIYVCEQGWPRNTAIAMTLALLAGIVATMLPVLLIPQAAMPESLRILIPLLTLPLLLALIASQFAANYLAGARVKK
jgi:Flp pilus assembly protein TadD